MVCSKSGATRYLSILKVRDGTSSTPPVDLRDCSERRQLSLCRFITWTTDDDEEPVTAELEGGTSVSDREDSETAEGNVKNGDVVVELADVEFRCGGHDVGQAAMYR